ncbi:MAG: hypothetical protein ACD_48C00547G0001 [uncultured bacterium]|nr:MAG: hypothetical protein ACD_48C00547G0001 [uncultured bacterium]
MLHAIVVRVLGRVLKIILHHRLFHLVATQARVNDCAIDLVAKNLLGFQKT